MEKARLIPIGEKTVIVADFINPFITATQKTLKVQAKLEVTSQQAALNTPLELAQTDDDVVAMITLSGRLFSGIASLFFDRSVYIALMTRILGKAPEAKSPEMQDGVGELLNVIVAHVRSELNGKGYNLSHSFPIILTGGNLSVSPLNTASRITIPFTSEIGVFRIELSIQNAFFTVQKDSEPPAK